MFGIKNIKIVNEILYIMDRKNKCHLIEINDSQIKNILPLASNRSAKIKKNIRYFEKYFKICIICMIICAIGALTPLLLGKSYAEVFIVGFGLLELASTGLAISSVLYKNWLKKYATSNEYWEEILEIVKNKENKKVSEKSNSNNRMEYNFEKARVNTSKIPDSRSNDNCTYSYSKNQIIQDYPVKEKIKTYKRY